MIPGRFDFITADKPSATVDLPSQGGRSSTSGFVVKEEATGNAAGFVNGGKGSSMAYVTCWQRAETASSATPINCSTDNFITGTSKTTAENKYTPDYNDFGNYIRYVVIPNDDESSGGEPKASEWVRIGVELTTYDVATNKIDASDLDAPVTTSIAGTQITSSSDKVLVFSKTSVQIDPNDPTDYLDLPGWSASSGTFDNSAKLSTFWNAPTTDFTSSLVVLSATVLDGAVPSIFGTYDPNDKEFTITIDKSKDKLTASASVNFIITERSGNGGPWYCAANSANSGWDDVNGEATFALSVGSTNCFKDDESTSFAGVGSSGKSYILSVEADAYTYKNKTTPARSNLGSFADEGTEIFEIKPTAPARPDVTYYSEPIKPTIFDVENISTLASVVIKHEIKVEYMAPNASGFDPKTPPENFFDVAATDNNIPTGEKATFTVTPKTLDAGRYVLTINISTEDTRFGTPDPIEINYTVNQVQITPVLSFTGGSANKYYDGTTALNEHTCNYSVSNSVTLPSDFVTGCGSGEFTDKNWGAKSYTEVFKLEVNGVNYVFAATGTANDYTLRGNADISKYKLGISNECEDNSLGEREYDGSNIFSNPCYALDFGSIIDLSKEDLNLPEMRIDLYLEDGNVNPNDDGKKSVTGSKIVLNGKDADNYELPILCNTSCSVGDEDVTELVGIITPASLATLIGVDNIFYKNKDGSENCKVNATAEYLDEP
jgi:hypothetical protein